MWDIGQENVHKNRHKVTKKVEEETNPGRKMCILPRKRREKRISATGTLGRTSVSLRVDTAPCLTGFADAVNNAVHCWKKAKRLRLERNQVCGEFETMLNSCPGKGIVGTGCAKMMMGSDTVQQLLSLLSLKERASIERVREKNRFRFGDNETRMSIWSAVIPMNSGGQVCREKVAIVASAVLDLEQRQVTFNKLGVTLNLEESANGHYVIDLIQGCADLIVDDSARGKTSGSVRRSRNESVKDSEATVETKEFSNLFCGSEKSDNH